MAVRNHEEIMSKLKTKFGDDDSEETLELVADISDTINAGNSDEWKKKYEENDRFPDCAVHDGLPAGRLWWWKGSAGNHTCGHTGGDGRSPDGGSGGTCGTDRICRRIHDGNPDNAVPAVYGRPPGGVYRLQF